LLGFDSFFFKEFLKNCTLPSQRNPKRGVVFEKHLLALLFFEVGSSYEYFEILKSSIMSCGGGGGNGG
jgi:hypothetical protein